MRIMLALILVIVSAILVLQIAAAGDGVLAPQVECIYYDPPRANAEPPDCSLIIRD